MTGKGDDSIVQKQMCIVEEVKEVEFRSRRAWEIYLLQNLQFLTRLVNSLDAVVQIGSTKTPNPEREAEYGIKYK